MTNKEFLEKLNSLNISFTEEMLDKLNIYCDFLLEYNTHTNLTAIRNREDVYLKHFYDSLTVTKAIDLNTINTMLDIGSGAGFPGIVLKIFYPHLKLTVLDSNNKKTTFISKLVEKLNLQEVNIVNDRAEEYAKKGIKYDLVTSRAVAYIDIILELSSYFVNEEGTILLMKGNIAEERSILDEHQKELNVINYNVTNCDLSVDDERNIIVIKTKPNNKVLNYNQILKRHNKWTSK